MAGKPVIATLNRERARLAVILTALDRLREVYPDDVGRFAEAMLRIVEAVSLPEDDEPPSGNPPR
jgi:hypothetical protein